jgi:hypothetical protein
MYTSGQYVCVRAVEWFPEVKVNDVVEVMGKLHKKSGKCLIKLGDWMFLFDVVSLPDHFVPVSEIRDSRINRVLS